MTYSTPTLKKERLTAESNILCFIIITLIIRHLRAGKFHDTP